VGVVVLAWFSDIEPINAICRVAFFSSFSAILIFLRGTVAERWSLTGELSLYCARPAADG